MDKDVEDLYKQAGIDTSSVTQNDQKDNPGLSFGQRLIVQNLFDTQPKRRAAYLNKLGYEMNPKDDNQYRPIGSTLEYDEIDPGIGAYTIPGLGDMLVKGKLKEAGQEVIRVAKEAGSDLADIAVDVGSGPFAGAMAIAGGTAFGIPGMFLAGAAANGTIEKAKEYLGDTVLDKDVPADKELMVLQSLAAGALPVVFKGAKVGAKEAQLAWLKQRKDAIINAAKKSGGGLNENIINKAIQNPDMFTKEATDGATQRLTGFYKNMFGMDDPLRTHAPEDIKSGMFSNVIDPLNKEAESEIVNLSKNQSANFSYEELAKPLIDKLNEYNKKPFAKTGETKAAYSYLRDELSSLKKMLSQKESVPEIKDAYGQIVVPASERETMRTMTFKEARDWLSARQKEVVNRDTAGNYINEYGKELAPTLGSTNGVLSILNNKASQVGSNLPEINKQRSRILDAYKVASEVLTPNNIERAFIGDDKISKDLIKIATSEVDNILGSNITKQIEDGSMQRVIDNLYKNPKNFGSGRVQTEMVQQGLEGAVKGGIGGAATGAAFGGMPGAKIGGLTGAVAGAIKGVKSATDMSSPERALEMLRQRSTDISKLEQSLGTSLKESMQNQQLPTMQDAAARALGQWMPPSDLPEDQNLDSIDPEVRKALGL